MEIVNVNLRHHTSRAGGIGNPPLFGLQSRRASSCCEILVRLSELHCLIFVFCFFVFFNSKTVLCS